jgi:hypothetical protein
MSRLSPQTAKGPVGVQLRSLTMNRVAYSLSRLSLALCSLRRVSCIAILWIERFARSRTTESSTWDRTLWRPSVVVSFSAQ